LRTVCIVLVCLIQSVDNQPDRKIRCRCRMAPRRQLILICFVHSVFLRHEKSFILSCFLFSFEREDNFISSLCENVICCFKRSAAFAGSEIVWKKDLMSCWFLCLSQGDSHKGQFVFGGILQSYHRSERMIFDVVFVSWVGQQSCRLVAFIWYM
jgi:hypothetical protein